MIDEIHPTNASLSTMWAIQNYPDLNDFLPLARHIGFSKIELNHQVDSAMLSQVHLDHYQFSSIHEPCPADIPSKVLVERDWLVSSPVEATRQRGVDAVKNSIRMAHQLQAPVVVVHCGCVSTDMQLEAQLRALYASGRARSDQFLDIKARFVQYRENLAWPRVQAVQQSLLELLDVADKYQVKLGLENRYHYLDIPSIDEMQELLALADSSRLGFIYDVGHAQALDRLGFYAHEDWLARYTGRIFGAHLHDVSGVVDHKAPGLGEVDFKLVGSYIPDQAFRTVEIQPGNTLAQLMRGLQVLLDTGCVKFL